jgi:hypothetical protein
VSLGVFLCAASVDYFATGFSSLFLKSLLILLTLTFQEERLAFSYQSLPFIFHNVARSTLPP